MNYESNIQKPLVKSLNCFVNLQHLICVRVELDQNSLKGLNSLKKLEIDKNSLIYINQSDKINKNMFEDLTSLEDLDIYCDFETNLNYLVNLKKFSTNHSTSNLKSFDENNNISHLRIINITPSSYKNLIQSLRRFESLETLELINLMNYENKISFFDCDFLEKQINIQHLRLESLGLERVYLNDNNIFPYLETINLSRNKLESIICNITALKSLDLSNCVISSTAKFEFANLVYLETLSLAKNKLTNAQMTGTLLDGLIRLKSLNLSRNLLGSFSFEWPKSLNNLEELNLKRNKLVQVQKGMLCGLFNLKRLDLSKNKIKSIENEAFSDLKKMEELILRENKLTELNQTIFFGLDSLEKLDLTKNRLKNQNFSHFSLSKIKNLKQLKQFMF